MTTWSLTPFWNEVDVLLIRLAELDPVVDIHVIAEAEFTYRGTRRAFELARLQHDPRFAPYQHKIRYVPVTEADVDYTLLPSQAQWYPSAEQIACWQRENSQRRALMRGLGGLEPDDVVLLSDVDEIPRASVIQWYRDEGATHLYRPPLAMHVGALNWVWGEAVPVIARLFRGSALLPRPDNAHDPYLLCEQDTEAMRLLPGPPANPPRDAHHYGWHLSYMGGVDAMRTKLEQAAHPEMATPAVLYPEHLERVLTRGDELFHRERGVHWVPNEPPYLPAAAAAYPHLTVPNPQENTDG